VGINGYLKKKKSVSVLNANLLGGIRKKMLSKKCFKFRIYSIKKQEKRLELALDQACFLYNQLLDIHQQIYLGEKKTLTEFDMNNLVKDIETKQLHSQVVEALDFSYGSM